ncbi:MAG: virulence factor SrfC family protein, partial [Reyranellales bacterium]
MTTGPNSDLATTASQTAVRSKDGFSWVTTPVNATRVGDPTALGYRLRRASLRAARLARAATRKMCVAVFGPSQAGKSYMVSVLASPPGGRLHTELDGQVYDFLRDINPPGGRESTGLVTRMTTDVSAAPKGFPIELRLLTQTELVKILANSFYLDFDLEHFDVVPPDADAIRSRLEQLRTLARPQPADRLTGDDVFDLMEYFQTHFPKRTSAFRDDFWREAIELAPRLEGRDRARLWSLFWYDFQAFTDLFIELYEGLRQLDFPSSAYAELGALIPRSGSIIDVTVLDRLGADAGDKVRLVPAGGTREVGLPRSLVAALTAELRITVKEKPSEVFDHTDLLDFPGARSRLGIKRLEDAGKDDKGESTANPLRELLLRGKVAYLFEGYTAEGEISALLLCVPDSVQEVRGLSGMVEDWVSGTLGARPEARAKEKCGLFLVLTKMDAEFVQKEGVDDKDKDWGIRIDSSLLKNFRGDWPTDWDGKPFRNLYWLRNPTIHDSRIMTYDGDKRETGIADAFRERHRNLHDTFVGNEIVRRHFENPEEAWSEAFRINDGGISYIVRRLTPICDPATKAAQVRNRLAELRTDIVRELERFHVAGDVEIRIAQRRQVGNRIMERLYDTNDPVQLGSLLKSMQVDGGDLAAYLYSVLVQGAATEGADPTGDAAAQAAALSSQRARIGRARPGAPATEGGLPAGVPAATGRATWERRAAREIMRCWESSMAASVDSPQLVRLLGIGRDLLAEISAELLALARRAGLESGMEKAIARVAITEQNEQRIAKAAMIGERFVNRLVSEMGFGETPVTERPTVTVDGASRPVFAPRAVVYGIDGWSAGPPTYFEEFFDDWANAFYRVIEDNAKSLAGLTVD